MRIVVRTGECDLANQAAFTLRMANALVTPYFSKPQICMGQGDEAVVWA